jgi:Ig-like domain CHU_C associated
MASDFSNSTNIFNKIYIMKRILTFLLVCIFKISLAQTNIAVPNYSSVTSSNNPATGNIRFYLNGIGFTQNVGHGANAVCFYEDNMFVAYDDGTASGNGLLWYKGVSFTTGNTFTFTSSVILVNNQQTFGVTVDNDANIYTANNNGTVTRFNRQLTAPFYTSAATTTMAFWTGINAKEASGIFFDIITNTLWVVSSPNNQAAVCKNSTFGTAGTIKYLTGPTNPTSFLQKPEGISKDASANVWIANNNNNTILRINAATVGTIVIEINAGNYTAKVLATPADIQSFSVGVSTYKLGGLAMDRQYSNKMFVNSQLSAGNTSVYEFNPSVATPVFSPSIGLSQVFPGSGQAAIIPCTILPVPANPTSVNNATVNVGQTATLFASGCATDQTYLWKLPNLQEGSSFASFTTPIINSTTTFTVHCVRGNCQSPGREVIVNVPPVVSTPFVSNVVVPRLNLDSLFFYLGNGLNPSNKYRAIGITPSGISFYNSDMFVTSNTTSGGGTLSWYQNVSLNPYNLTPATTPTNLTPIFNFNGVGSSKGVAVDQQGNIYVASSNGLLSKFYRSQTAPFYANNRQVGVRVGTSNNDIMGGLSYDETTATIWMTNFTTKKIVVINAAEIPALPAVLTANIPVSATKDTYVKIIEPPTALQYAFDDPLGIAFVLASGVWVSSNVNQGVVSRIKIPALNSILADLNNNIYTTKTLTAIDIDVYTSFAGTGGLGNRFGAITYDNIYSKKLIMSDQPAATGPTKNMISIDPFAANPLSTFAYTQYKQTFGGISQVGIIPCILLPTPANPVATSFSIPEGTAASLTASGCSGAQGYLWRDPTTLTTVGNSQTFVTPALNTSKTYTVYCINGLNAAGEVNCISSGVAVVVTVVPSGTPCPNTVVISQAANPSYAANAIVKATDFISMQAPPLISISTANSNNLTYQAGKAILLSPGFSVNAGAVFKAVIGVCN